jgi:hypothetical protein
VTPVTARAARPWEDTAKGKEPVMTPISSLFVASVNLVAAAGLGLFVLLRHAA